MNGKAVAAAAGRLDLAQAHKAQTHRPTHLYESINRDRYMHIRTIHQRLWTLAARTMPPMLSELETTSLKWSVFDAMRSDAGRVRDTISQYGGESPFSFYTYMYARKRARTDAVGPHGAGAGAPRDAAAEDAHAKLPRDGVNEHGLLYA